MILASFLSHRLRSRSTFSRWAGFGTLPNRPREKRTAAQTLSNASVDSSCGTSPIFERAQRRRQWQYVHPRSLADIKVGVLGLGELGAPAAQALAGLGFDVRGWSRSAKTIAGVTCTCGRSALDLVLAGAEIRGVIRLRARA